MNLIFFLPIANCVPTLSHLQLFIKMSILFLIYNYYNNITTVEANKGCYSATTN